MHVGIQVSLESMRWDTFNQRRCGEFAVRFAQNTREMGTDRTPRLQRVLKRTAKGTAPMLVDASLLLVFFCVKGIHDKLGTLCRLLL